MIAPRKEPIEIELKEKDGKPIKIKAKKLTKKLMEGYSMVSDREESDELKLMKYDSLKNQVSECERCTRRLFQWCLNNLPREQIINELKKKKIAGFDWREEKYKLLEKQ
jgi:hypothetical protein